MLNYCLIVVIIHKWAVILRFNRLHEIIGSLFKIIIDSNISTWIMSIPQEVSNYYNKLKGEYTEIFKRYIELE